MLLPNMLVVCKLYSALFQNDLENTSLSVIKHFLHVTYSDEEE